jgi:hypothetical protein
MIIQRKHKGTSLSQSTILLFYYIIACYQSLKWILIIILLRRDLLNWYKRILGIDLNFEDLIFASSGCKLIIMRFAAFSSLMEHVLGYACCFIAYNKLLQ